MANGACCRRDIHQLNVKRFDVDAFRAKPQSQDFLEAGKCQYV
jgi:hypothetical protein